MNCCGGGEHKRLLSEIDSDDSEELLVEKNRSPEIKLASATVDLLFFKRLYLLMSFSGTTLFSFPALLLFWTLLFSIAYGILVGEAANWLGEAVSYVSILDFDKFWSTFYIGIGLYGILGLIDAGLDVIRMILAWIWRKNIAQRITEEFMNNITPFSIVYLKEFGLDNPDQRIVRDVDSMCNAISKITTVGIRGVCILGFVTHSYSVANGWKPVFLSYAMAFIMVILYLVLLKPLAKYVFRQDAVEGDFRYAHARVREYAESIAFFEGQEMERKYAEETLAGVVNNQRSVAKWTGIFAVYTTLNQYIPQMSGLVANAIFIWDEIQDTNQMAQTYVTAITLGGSLMDTIYGLVQLGSDVGILAGNVARAAQLYELSFQLNKSTTQRQCDFVYDPEVIKLENVTCNTPQHTTLVYNLNLEINSGNNILIMGPSGAGKSSLLRAIAGLWKCDGTITKPKNIGRDGMFYLPQKPYLVTGNLRDQILYPRNEPYGNEDEDLMSYLEMANVSYLISQYGWDSVIEWQNVLSPGEQQRLAMSRLFYHRPRFAILDESTSALDSKNEEIVYKKCKELKMTLISVAHRKTLLRYHDTLLKFNGEGGFTLDPINEAVKKESGKQKEWVVVEDHPGSLDITSPDTVEVFNDEKIEKDTEKALNNRSYFVRLFELWKRMHTHSEGSNTITTALLVSLFFIIIILVGGLASWQLLTGELFQTFLTRDKDGFILAALKVVSSVVSLACLIPTGLIVSMFLGVRYRKNLTNYIHDIYFRSRDMILQMNTVHKDIDNVDQRITTNVNDVCSGFENPNTDAGLPFLLLNLSTSFLTPLIQLVLLLNYEYGGWVPFASIIGFTILGIVVGLIFMHFIAKFTIIKSKHEGDYRYAHIKIRENAEAICYYGNEAIKREVEIVTQDFQKTLAATRSLIIANSAFSVYVKLLIQLAKPASVIIIVVALSLMDLSGNSNDQIFAAINQMKEIIGNSLLTSIQMVTVLGPLARHRGNVARVAQLIERMRQVDFAIASKGELGHRAEGDGVSLENVSYSTPTGKDLIDHGITVNVNPKDRLLLMGPSGCGKSSLLRVISSLWPLKRGNIISPRDIFFVPQKPYMVIGSLRDQLIYPVSISHSLSDDKLFHYFNLVNLGYLLNRFSLESVEIWNSVLSPGEQQRLSLARLFYHSPSFAVLDESTSALDVQNEEMMYDLCTKLNIGLISVGHRETLIHFHNMMLTFDGKGGWALRKENNS